MRLLVALVLLLAGAAAAQANSTFDTYIESLSPTNYWPETTNGNDLVGSNNPSAVGSCTFGQSLSTNVSGVTCSSAGYLSFSSLALTSSSGWQIYFRTNPTTSTTQQAFLYLSIPGSNQGLAFMINTGPVCPSGTVDFRFVVSGSNYDTCSTATVNDGNDHSVFERCFGGYCQFYIDSVYQTGVSYPFSSYSATSYGFTNYPPSGAYPLLGPIGGIALWLGDSPFAQNLIASIDTCAKTGVCVAPVTGCIPTSPAPLWCETFTGGASGDGVQYAPPQINTPYLDTSSLTASIQNGGSCTQGVTCNAGKTLSGLSPTAGDFVIAGPGAVQTCNGIPEAVGFPYGQVLASGLLSATAGFGGICKQPLLAYKGNTQASSGSISGTTFAPSGGTFLPYYWLYDTGGIINVNTYVVASIGGGNYSVNVSQTSSPTTPITGSLWGPNAAGTGVFNTISCADSNAGGIGTTGVTANALRLFGQSLQEGFVTGCIYFSQPGSHGWATSGIQVVQINSSGSNTNGVMMAAYNPSGGSVAPTYGTLSGSGIGNCAMSPSSISVLYNNWYRFVLAWRSAADSSGYTKFYLDNLVIPAASAFGNNQASPCNMPSTLNALALEAEATADSPTAEYYVGEVAAYAGPYSAGQSPNVALIQ